VIGGTPVRSVDLSAPRFISDLHLSREQPETLERFLRLTDHLHSGELLILGDLFEYWAGDDEAREGIGATVAAALRAVHSRGVPVYLMRGNRDLLIGTGFADAAGAVLLEDPCLTILGGVPTLLCHGDAYCTLDTAYIAYRKRARNPVLQRLFLSLPLAVRRALIGQVRQISESGKRTMAAQIMDVTPEAINQALRAAGASRMIHGHTHRPQMHRFTLDGKSAERWVLPDWDFDSAAPRGGFLHMTDGRPEVVPV
jgi:UDP-2,3-diacylglucosamine hydrolase